MAHGIKFRTPAARPARVAPEELRTEVILAEDDEELRGLLAEILRDEGYHVTEAKDGTELLDVIVDEVGGAGDVGAPPPPQILITDIRMPQLSGLDVVRGLRESLRDLPVIMITASGDGRLHDEARRMGVLVMQKPLELDRFLNIVMEAYPPRVPVVDE